MCIVVDPPLFVPMLKCSDPDHAKYAPVLDWVSRGCGKFVTGGTKYQEQINGVRSVIPLLTEFQRRGKIIRVDRSQVDGAVAILKDIEPSNNFDDPHLVALVRVSGCGLICVNDPRSHKYLRDSRFYASKKARPRLYTRPKNSNLLCNNNIAPCCR